MLQERFEEKETMLKELKLRRFDYKYIGDNKRAQQAELKIKELENNVNTSIICQLEQDNHFIPVYIQYDADGLDMINKDFYTKMT